MTWCPSEHDRTMSTEKGDRLVVPIKTDNGTWVLMFSRQCQLSTGLVMRGELWLNWVGGVTHPGMDAIETVNAMVPELLAQVKVDPRLQHIERGGHPA